jgi:hypothetical protein
VDHEEIDLPSQPIAVEDESQSAQSPIAASPISSITEEQLDEMADFAAHMLQPSAYAIPPQPEEVILPAPKQEMSSSPPASSEHTPSIPRSLPPSIPRRSRKSKSLSLK